MKRDIKLIRKLLFEIEDKSDGIVPVFPIVIDGHDQSVINYHLTILYEAGLIHAHPASSAGDMDIIPVRLTWEGHEFLDSARSDTIWNKTLKQAGEFSESIAIPLLKDLLIATLRSQIGLG